LLHSVFERKLRDANRVNKQFANRMTLSFGFIPERLDLLSP